MVVKELLDLVERDDVHVVARLGTLSAAAEELHVTQPALSRSMRRLEQLLGASLFGRGKSRIALNATGRVAAEQAAVVLRANRDLEDRVRAFDRSLHTLSVGGCAPYPLGVAMTAIQRKLSGMAVSTEVMSDEALVTGLLDHRCQLVVLHDNPHDPDCTCDPSSTSACTSPCSRGIPCAAGRRSPSPTSLRRPSS